MAFQGGGVGWGTQNVGRLECYPSPLNQLKRPQGGRGRGDKGVEISVDMLGLIRN